MNAKPGNNIERYPLNTTIPIQRPGGIVEATVVQYTGEDNFDDDTGRPWMKISFTEDGVQKSKEVTDAELDKLVAMAVHINNTREKLLRGTLTKYPIGTEVAIQRSKGIVSAIIVENDEDNFDDMTGKPLFTLSFVEDGLSKRKTVTGLELEQLVLGNNHAEHVQGSRSDILNGNDASSLKEAMVPYRTPEGHSIVAATDKGVDYSDHNEDRMFVDVVNGVVAAIDGMGGMGHGDKAADILAQEIQKTPKNIPNAAIRASERMLHELPFNKYEKPGACFTAIDIQRNLVFHAGDTKCIVFDKNGNAKFKTVDQSTVQRMVDSNLISEDNALYNPIRNAVNGYVSANRNYVTTIDINNKLQPGDRVIVMSDGISDNLTTEEIWNAIQGRTPENAMANVSDITSRRMANADMPDYDTRQSNSTFPDGYRTQPKKDNRAFAVIDIK